MTPKRTCIEAYLRSSTLFSYSEIAARCGASVNYVSKIAQDLVGHERVSQLKPSLVNVNPQYEIDTYGRSELSDVTASPVMLSELFDVKLLEKNMAEGLISARHRQGFTIYNYTNAAAYGRHWDDATMLCRGLIVDDAGCVVARPFHKFFNPSEPHAPTIPVDAEMHISDKMDGSLGIGYTDKDGESRIATRGSMESTQARTGTEILKTKYADVRFPRYLTPLFEIIAPDNRIVVDYGDTLDLVLLSVIDIETGADLDLHEFDWPGPIVQQYDFESFSDLLTHVETADSSNREGYVVRFDTGTNNPHVRLKLKFPEYVAHHRIVTGLTSGKIWEILALADAQQRGVDPKRASSILHLNLARAEPTMKMLPDPITGYRQTLPEEFIPWYDVMVNEISLEAHATINLYRKVVQQALNAAEDDSQKAFALAAIDLATKHRLEKGPLFKLKNNSPDAYTAIWALMKPSNHLQQAERL